MEVVHVAIDGKLLVFDQNRCRLTVSPWKPDADGVDLFMQLPYVNEDGSNSSIWKVVNEHVTFEDGIGFDLEEEEGEFSIELSSIEGDDVCLVFKLPEGWDVVSDPTPPEERQDDEEDASHDDA